MNSNTNDVLLVYWIEAYKDSFRFTHFFGRPNRVLLKWSSSSEDVAYLFSCTDSFSYKGVQTTLVFSRKDEVCSPAGHTYERSAIEAWLRRESVLSSVSCSRCAESVCLFWKCRPGMLFRCYSVGSASSRNLFSVPPRTNWLNLFWNVKRYVHSLLRNSSFRAFH